MKRCLSWSNAPEPTSARNSFELLITWGVLSFPVGNGLCYSSSAMKQGIIWKNGEAPQFYPDCTFRRNEALSPCLEVGMIKESHHASIFLKNEAISFLQKVVWMPPSIELLNAFCMTADNTDSDWCGSGVQLPFSDQLLCKEEEIVGPWSLHLVG